MTVTVNIPIERYEELIAIEKAHEELTHKPAEQVEEEAFEALSNERKILYAQHKNAPIERIYDPSCSIGEHYRIKIFGKLYTVSLP
tara:strand:- start:340 stop:597 length:258 start_codon:yes stop_codon:yes gene_type:complete